MLYLFILSNSTLFTSLFLSTKANGSKRLKPDRCEEFLCIMIYNKLNKNINKAKIIFFFIL